RLCTSIRCLRDLHTSKISQAKVQLNNVNINYEIFGSGKKVAICLPGALGTHKSDFGPQLQSLAGDEVTLVAWDPPGYGDSRPPPRNFTLDFLNKDAALADQMMKHLGYDKYSVLGWSDGGITGMILAAAFPDSVEKLIIWGANAYLTDQDIKIYNGIRDINKWSARMRAPLEATYGVDYFKNLWEGWVDTFIAIHKEKNGDLCMGDLANINCSTLIIHGVKDPMVPIEHADFLHKNIKGSRLILMEEGKHNLHLRYANEFNRMVLDFLE
ncbi:unnamed protein product, partial [Meganyctiphanes norvegica]